MKPDCPGAAAVCVSADPALTVDGAKGRVVGVVEVELAAAAVWGVRKSKEISPKRAEEQRLSSGRRIELKRKEPRGGRGRRAHRLSVCSNRIVYKNRRGDL